MSKSHSQVSSKCMAGAVLFVTVCLALFSDGYGQVPSLFECQSSSTQEGLTFTPNIPDYYFDHEKVANFSSGDPAKLTRTGGVRNTFIFSVPAQAICEGTIVSIQYCYEARQTSTNGRVFDMITLNRNGSHFTVVSSFRVRSTTSSSICTNSQRRYCCDKFDINSNNQIELTTSGITYGVVNRNNNVRPLVFSDSSTEFHAAQFFATPSNRNLWIGRSFSGNQQNMRSLLVLRFFIESSTSKTTTAEGPEINMSMPTATTEQLVDMTTPDTEAPLTSSDSATLDLTSTTITTTTTESILVALSTGSMQEQSTEHSTTHEMTTAFIAVASQSSGPLVGGVFGGITVIIVLPLAVMICLIVVVRRQKRLKSTIAVTTESDIALSNMVYDIGVSHVRSEQVSKKLGVETKCNYAEVGATAGNGNLYEDVATNLYEVPTNDMEEDLYMVPAMDEEGLYSQLGMIYTDSLCRESIKLGKQLGSGQFGVVYKGVWLSPEGEIDLAVKTLREGSAEEDRVKFLQEAAIMGQFKHHNVVTMYGVVTNGEPILIALELLLGGDLRQHLLQFRLPEGGLTGIDDHTLLSYCRQVASGMAYLSSKAFVHRDLAARNVLVSHSGICKIADFGMSRDLMNETYYVSHGGMIPVKWTAPEALHYKKYSTASDVWSYGVLMYEIWSVGHKPFESITNSQALAEIDRGHRLPPPPGCPRALYKIMIQCWNPMSSKRPKFPEISRQLSLPDSKLLKWSEEDKAVHPETANIGGDLLSAQELYKDLQFTYRNQSLLYHQ